MSVNVIASGETMRIVLTVKADELKLIQLLAKLAETYKITYSLTRRNGDFEMVVNTDAEGYGELQRRLGHLSDCNFSVKEVHGGGLLDRINVRTTKTNVDALIGKTTVAKTDIDPEEGGIVKLFGELWFCRSTREKAIKKGTRVVVVGIEGVSLMVEEVT